MRSNDSRKTARSTGFGTGGHRLRFSDFPILTVSSQMVSSALLMMNSQVIAAGTTARPANGFGEMLAKHGTPDAKVRAIFLSCLSRLPSGAESSRWMSHVTKASGTAGYEDLMWTLLNTSEFLFTH